MTTSFTQTDGLNALGIYGAAFERWPDQDLAAYVQSSPDLQSHVKAAINFDTALLHRPIPAPSDLLKNRILKAAAQTPQDTYADEIPANESRQSPSRFKAWRRIAALLLVSIFVGGTVWIAQSPAEPDLTLTAEIDAETDAWRSAANEMDMMDIFLWVETDNITG